MLERDYIMRLIRQFFEALEKLKEEKAEKQSSTLQLEIHSMYRAYFHQPESFFTNKMPNSSFITSKRNFPSRNFFNG